MAVIYCDGFPVDTSTLNTRWTVQNSPIVGTGGRWGARYAQGGDTGGLVRAVTPCNPILVQFGWRRAVVTSYQHPVLTLYVDAALSIYMWADNTNRMWFKNWETTNVASSPGGYDSYVWHQIEIKVYLHASAGTVKLKVNGATVVDASNLRTCWGTANCGGIRLFAADGGEGGNRSQICDLIVMDTSGSYCNDLLGTKRVQPFVPTADGYYKMSTPSTGVNRYATVDEIPPSSADYNTLTAIGDTDTFAIDDLPAAQDNIHAVVCSVYGKTTNAGACSVKGVARSNSLDGYGNVLSAPASSAYMQSVIYVDPNTGVPFTNAGFNAAEFGYKRET